MVSGCLSTASEGIHIKVLSASASFQFKTRFQSRRNKAFRRVLELHETLSLLSIIIYLNRSLLILSTPQALRWLSNQIYPKRGSAVKVAYSKVSEAADTLC